MAMQSGNTVQRFSYDAQGKVVSVNYNGTEYYYLRNAQGDIVKLIDGSRNTVVEYTYDSWGKVLATTGSLATSLGANQPFRYRGYVYDTETSWYYLQSRYYDPNTCRFISSDVYLSTGQGVIGHNSYAYCGNNPVNRADGKGEFWHLVVGAAIGAVVGFVSNVASQVIEGNSLSEINWGSAAISAATGAVTGLLTASGAGALAVGIGGAAISAVEEVATQSLEAGKLTITDGWKVVDSAAFGFVTGYFSGGGATKQLKLNGTLGKNSTLTKRFLSNVNKKSYRYYMSQTWTLQKRVMKKHLKESIKDAASNALKGGINKMYKNFSLLN